MTGQTVGMSMDGTPISAADVARMEAEEKLHAERQRRAARVVAAAALDADDCRMLLDILGLDREVVAAAREGTSKTDDTKPTVARGRTRAA